MSQQPKKPKQPRSKRLKVSKKEQWERILKDIDKSDAPISCLLKALDHIIDDVDFYISVDSVAKTVQPITDSILKDL